ncbi:hypothetical protein [Nocardiopsis sp. FR4]|uniref:hypothetical protein n=1 Tax=Nocardiopsis sp. FR4 TaxID=2605985 RepID=UPI001356F167|nr:hypothetical protein [Nocardiopsis sp. FR4]
MDRSINTAEGFFHPFSWQSAPPTKKHKEGDITKEASAEINADEINQKRKRSIRWEQ